MNRFRKAYTAAAVALAGSLGAALVDGHLTIPETLVAIGVGLLAGAGVYQVKNDPS